MKTYCFPFGSCSNNILHLTNLPSSEDELSFTLNRQVEFIFSPLNALISLSEG